MIFDENNSLIKGYIESDERSVGSGCYPDKMWKCMKCGWTYSTYGSLRFYHTKRRCNVIKDKFNFYNPLKKRLSLDIKEKQHDIK